MKVVLRNFKHAVSRFVIAKLLGEQLVEKILEVGTHRPRLVGSPKRLHVSAKAYLNNALLNTLSGNIRVDDFAFCGFDVKLLAGSHDIEVFDERRVHGIPEEGLDIHVEKGVFIGSGAIILGPVTLGEHSVIAAGSVVTKDVGPYEVVAGVPARAVRVLNRPAE